MPHKKYALNLFALMVALAALWPVCLAGCAQQPSIELHICQGETDYSTFNIQSREDGENYLMLTKDGNKPRGHVNVVFINKSSRTWILQRQHTRWGWYNIRFVFTDESGKKYTVKNSEVVFRVLEEMNEVRLAPGNVFVRDCFIQGWEWTPELPEGSHVLTGHAVFSVKPMGYSFGGPVQPFVGPIRSNQAKITVDNGPWLR